jgi:glycine dehydrogenase subunit 1
MKLIRQMPGRIIGLTTTRNGDEQGFCMALQTREQHIRRERATSNICSNEALCAIAAAVYMALLGSQGIRELSKIIMSKANYAMRLISEIQKIEAPIFESTHFKEFTINFDAAGMSVQDVNEQLLLLNIHGGKDLSKEVPELGETALYCITEIHSRTEIDGLVEALDKVVSKV